MSLAYFIVLDHPNPGFDTFVNGKFIAHEAEALARLANALGLQPLESYLSNENFLTEDLTGDGESTEEEEVDDESQEGPWFAAAAGLHLVRSLIAYLEKHPQSMRHTEDVLQDLREYLAVLMQADQIGARWRLAVDF